MLARARARRHRRRWRRVRPPPAERAAQSASAGPTGGPVRSRRPCPSSSEPSRRPGPARSAKPCAGPRTIWASRWPSSIAPMRPSPLLEESYRLGTGGAMTVRLLMRCYINVPAVRRARGDPPQPLAEMVEEGLQPGPSLRGQQHHRLAGRQPGRVHGRSRAASSDALRYQDEAILHTRAVQSVHLNTKLQTHAAHPTAARRDRGGGARHGLEEAEALGSDAEPQVAGATR